MAVPVLVNIVCINGGRELKCIDWGWGNMKLLIMKRVCRASRREEGSVIHVRPVGARFLQAAPGPAPPPPTTLPHFPHPHLH